MDSHAPRYVPPTFGESAFNCPYCRVYAHHHWSSIFLRNGNAFDESGVECIASKCGHCLTIAYWLIADKRLIYPPESTAPFPSPDMPEDIAADYNEARSVLNLSPRSSAALLRQCVQKLCKYLGKNGDINDSIAALVKDGLSPRLQKSFDILRITGNNAVHTGQLDLKDNQEIALKLFHLLNMIVEEMITRPHEIDELYAVMPEGARQGIEKRDKLPKDDSK